MAAKPKPAPADQARAALAEARLALLNAEDPALAEIYEALGEPAFRGALTRIEARLDDLGGGQTAQLLRSLVGLAGAARRQIENRAAALEQEARS